MVWISLFLLSSIISANTLPPTLMTKHSNDTLRFITMDGRYAYIQKRAGVLGMVSSFRSIDFLSENSTSDFLVTGSRHKQRLVIEVIPNMHSVYSLVKNNKILVVNWGNSQAKEIGTGRNAKLHVNDEWITYFDVFEKVIHVQNVITQKKYDIRLSAKTNPFYVPFIEMLTPENVVYTDVNENGYAAVISYNLLTKKSVVIFKSPQNATRLELCQHENYLAFGEFPYEGASRGSKIMQIKLGGNANLAGYSTVYSSSDADLGNMVCQANSIYFVKTTGIDKTLTTKTTDAARLDLKTQEVKFKTKLGNVAQIIEMDDRIMIPHRGEFYVVEGKSNLGSDVLKSSPSEELPLEL